jgi:hypothetical protein
MSGTTPTPPKKGKKRGRRSANDPFQIKVQLPAGLLQALTIWGQDRQIFSKSAAARVCVMWAMSQPPPEGMGYIPHSHLDPSPMPEEEE